MRYLTKLITLTLGCVMAFSVQALSPESQSVADYAVKTYEQAMLDSLTKLVSFKTVATKGMTPDNNPEFIGFKAELKQLALELDLSYSDHGYVLLIGLGEHDEKLGVITQGDVQPANPKLWAQDPFILDTQSQPGQLIGRGIEAEQFGDITYRDDFMGPMTLAPTVVEQADAGTKVTLNLRRPVGKTPELLDIQTTKALKTWQTKHDVNLLNVETHWGKPMVMEDAPHLKTLLAVFSHFSGVKDPQPVAIGGSTNSKLFPNALSFGPTMPGKAYTGHIENEFMTQEQFTLNLKMYTAAFIELAVEKSLSNQITP